MPLPLPPPLLARAHAGRRIRRTPWLGAVLAATALLATACAPRSAPAPQPTLRVMSFNIAAGQVGGIDGVAEAIRAAGADVVGLQEVDVHWSERSGFADQADELARRTGMHVFFGPIYRSEASAPGRPAREFGLAILSWHPFVATHNHPLSRLSTQRTDPEPEPLPGFLEAVVDVGGTRVHVFNTHLDYRGDPRVRRMQVAEMRAVMDDGARPTLLLGDLNARPDAPELQPLFGELRDAWSDTGDPGYTFPAAAPDRRIDYVLHSRHFETHRARVAPGEVSDHRAVIAELRLRPDAER